MVSILLMQNDIIFSIIAFLSSSDMSFLFRHEHIAAIFSPQAIILFLSFSDMPFMNPAMIELNIFSILSLLSKFRSVINGSAYKDIPLVLLKGALFCKDGF